MVNNHKLLIPSNCMVPLCGKALPQKPAYKRIAGLEVYCCNKMCLNDYEFWMAGLSVRNMKTPQ